MEMYDANEDFFLSVYIILLVVFMAAAIFSSTLVICSVLFNKKLHKPQHVIILALSAKDFLSGVVLIPLDIAVSPILLETIQESLPEVCLISRFFMVFLYTVELLFLAVLCLDRFIKWNFPNFYKRRIGIKKICMALTGIVIRQLIFSIVSVLVISGERDTWCDAKIPSWLIDILGNVFIIFISIILFLISEVYLIERRRSQGHSTNIQSITLVNRLIFVFLASYLPILIFYIYYLVNDFNPSQVLKDFLRLLKYLQTVSNGFVIAMTSHIYERTFKCFLTTNPMRWKKSVNRILLSISEPETVEPSMTDLRDPDLIASLEDCGQGPRIDI